MTHSLYAHYWSIADQGPAAFADDLRQGGYTAVSYAVTYHRVRQLLPSDPRRHIFFSDHSHAYFPARDHRYGRIRPRPSPLLGTGERFRELLSALEDRGLGLRAWVVGCHNTDLALAHPDCAIRNALGDVLPHHLCPSNPDVADYLVALLTDVAEQCHPSAFELEAFEFPGAFEHGAHHEMSGIPLDRFHSGLLALCFCPSCRGAAQAQGVDSDQLASDVGRQLARYLDTPAWLLTPQGEPGAAEAFAAAHPALATYRATQAVTLVALDQRLRQAVAAVAPTRLLMIGHAERAEPWADGVVVPSTPEAVNAARTLLGAGKDIVCGIYPMAPRPMDPETIYRTMTACAAAGCSGFNYYNHALMQRSTHQAIAAGITRLRDDPVRP